MDIDFLKGGLKMSGNFLQWVQIGLALLIAYLVHENGKAQTDMLDKKHKEIIALLGGTP